MRKTTPSKRIKGGKPAFNSMDEMRDYLVAHCGAKKSQVNALKAIASGSKTWKQAIARHMKNLDPKRGDVTLRNQLGTLLVHLTENLFYGEDEQKADAPVRRTRKSAKVADVAHGTRGRKPNSKNRPKDVIAAEKRNKELMRKAREELGIGSRGRLSEEQQKMIADKIRQLQAEENIVEENVENAEKTEA